MDKYYTPLKEEFYIGFEYESYYGPDDYRSQVFDKFSEYVSGGWDCDIYDTLDCELDNKDPKFNIRVKYLDRSDIESLGFMLIEGIKPGKDDIENYSWTFHKKAYPTSDTGSLKDYYIQLTYSINQCYNKDDKLIDPIRSVSIRYKHLVESWEDKRNAAYVINGARIKNKSELIKLLKQLNIE